MFTISPADWNALINYSANGEIEYDGYDYSAFANYYRDAFVPTLLREGARVPTLAKFPATLLSIPHRILHDIVSHTLLPRGGNHAIVYNTDLFFMWAILTEAQINWPHTFCQVMVQAKRDDDCHLPYPMLIQKMIEMKNVSLTGEVFYELKANNKFAGTALKKAKIRKIDNVWTWTIPPPAPDAEPMDEDDAPPADVVAPAAPQATDAPMDMMALLTTIHSDFRATLPRIERMEQDIQTILTRLPPPPPPPGPDAF